MNETALPPSPNWYLSSVLACAPDGTVAWGSENSLVIAKKPEVAGKSLQYTVIPNVHEEKLNAVAFCPDPSKKMLVTSGNDHILKLWNFNTLELICSRGYVVDQKFIGVDWSRVDFDLICAISDRGTLHTWNTRFNTHQMSTLGKITATCIACSPHKIDSIAVGTKSGLVFIVNRLGQVNYKLRGHDVEIVSLSWCPSPLNHFSETPKNDYLLASGAKDKKIFVWKTTDGRYETQLSLPSAPQDSTQHRTKLNNSVGAFTAVLWVDPHFLVAGSAFGELLYLKISPIKGRQRRTWELIHGAHSRAIFAIASWVKTIPAVDSALDTETKEAEDANWRTEKGISIPENLVIWSTGQERHITSYCSKQDKDNPWQMEYNIPTLGGYVYCLAACPLDTSTIAFGVGDGVLRVWNLSEPHENTFSLNVFWQKIMGRITAIAWHPEKENLVAYGTSDGRIGVCDTCNPNKPPNLLRQHHRKTIYRLQWAPGPQDDQNKSNFSIYSCGDGELVCFNYKKYQEEPKIIVKKNCTEFSWKPDFSCLAVGQSDGAICFFNKSLQSLSKKIYLLKKTIENIVWHPESTATDHKFSEFKNYIAVSSATPTISIFDLSTLMDKLEETDETKDETGQTFFKIVATLTGHTERIFSLAWSPHFSGYLVSGSKDSTVQIWKVDSQQLIGTYKGHCSGVQSVMWSPLDSDLMISGSQDWSLRVWRISDREPILPIEVTTPKKSKKSKKVKTSEPTKETETVSFDAKLDSPMKSSSESTDNAVPSHSNVLPKETISTPKSKKQANHFAIYKRQIKEKKVLLKKCLDLAKLVVAGDDVSATIFGSKEDVLNVMKTESENHLNQDQWKLATEINLWGNSLKDLLIKAKEDKTLTDYMVSLAPSLSLKFWQEICEAYAYQLLEERNIAKSVSYFLVIHKIHTAIEILITARWFREAYAIATCRLDPGDSIIKDILNRWSISAFNDGCYEETAQCMIVNNELSEAARMLARRKDAMTLEAAADIASVGHDLSLMTSIAEDALNATLNEGDYGKARELVEKFAFLVFRKFQIEAHETIREALDMDSPDSYIVNWFNGQCNYSLVEDLRLKMCLLGLRDAEFEFVYAVLKGAEYPSLQGIYLTEEMLWLRVSREFVLSVAADNDEDMMKHGAAAISEICQYEIMNPDKTTGALIKVLAKLDGVSPWSETSVFQQATGVQKSFRVYLCYALINWLISVIKKSRDTGEQTITVNLFLVFLQEAIPCVLDKETVDYTMATSEVIKLENSLTAGANQDATAEMIQKLERIKLMQRSFVEKRVHAPSPMVVYSRALELANLLDEGMEKNDFLKAVNDAWKNATASDSET